jgi:hypothetical protein
MAVCYAKNVFKWHFAVLVFGFPLFCVYDCSAMHEIKEVHKRNIKIYTLLLNSVAYLGCSVSLARQAHFKPVSSKW